MVTALAAAMIVSAAAAAEPATRAAQAGGASTATAPAARGTIEKLMQQVVTALRDAKLSREDKRTKVRQLADENIDFETLGRLAMGANWRNLTEAQRGEYNKEFRVHVINTYAHITDEYTDEDLVVGTDNAEARNDWTVQTRIMGLKDGVRQEIAKVDYRLRQKEGRWMIIDVTIDGVSLMANFRSQFQDIMTNGGIDRLLKLLREKNATGAAAPVGKGK
jgi:phospholipid transport system substrate-binding protein